MPTNGLHGQGRLQSRPGQTPAGATPVGLLSLGSDDTGSAEGYLYVPAGSRTETPAPLVLLLHGAGEVALDGLAQLRGQADETRLILLALSSSGPTWDSIRSRHRSHRSVARARLLPMCDRSGARWGRGLLRRGLLRPLTRDRKRRPVLARARLLTGVPGTCWPDGLDAHLHLARHPRRVAPDRLLQPQARSPAGACWIRGTLPRVRRRPRGPARNCAGGRDLVHRRGLKTCRPFALV